MERNIYKIENELYIVNDIEEINKDTKTCWCIDISCNELVLYQGVLPSYHYKYYKKIIMTTDKSINVLCSCGKDCGAKESGIQAIDKEFLEWFVKNPGCEEVLVTNLYGDFNPFKYEYKIIIPNLEIWKDVPNYNGLYQASNLGNIRSLNYGKIRELKPRLVGYDGNQYLAVNLSKDSEVKSIKVHKLIALCFLNHTSKGYDGLVIDHIDSNKLNNRLDNLKLVTPRFNASKDKKGSSSKFTGVTWHKKSEKWQCQIYDNGKLNHLGLFNTEIEASETYNNYLENMTKEEPKQRLEKYSERFDNDKSPIGNPETWGKRLVDIKQETLEEFAERLYPKSTNQVIDFANELRREGIIKNAKWQQERGYSEEDLKKAFQDGQDNMDYSEMYGWSSELTEQEWFEQFKKK